MLKLRPVCPDSVGCGKLLLSWSFTDNKRLQFCCLNRASELPRGDCAYTLYRRCSGFSLTMYSGCRVSVGVAYARLELPCTPRKAGWQNECGVSNIRALYNASNAYSGLPLLFWGINQYNWLVEEQRKGSYLWSQISSVPYTIGQ